MRILILLLVCVPLFCASKQRVAVVGGMWPMPSLLAVWTDAEVIYMPKASLNMIQNSILIDFFPYLKEVQAGPNSDDSIEEILKLKADLYICHNAQKKLCEMLENSGVKSLCLGVNIENHNSKKTLEYWIDNLAKYFPIKDKNKELIDDITQTEKFIEERVKDARKPRVLIVHRTDKNVITTGFFANYLTAKSGGEVFLKQNSVGNARVSINLEEVYKQNPEIIYISNFTSLTPEELMKNKEWQGLEAVKNQKVYKLPLATYRPFAPSLDLSPLLLYLAKQNHPEIFKDLNIGELYKNHFKKFYGLDLNGAQIQKILNPSPKAGRLE